MVLGEFWLRLDKTMLMWLFFLFFFVGLFLFFIYQRCGSISYICNHLSGAQF